MKLHDLRPAPGSRTPRTRVGRGIAAGKGKTAGKGTKGQNARTGGGVQPWFEGGQTPLQIRIPKLRGFRNRFRVEYEVVNVGRISALVDLGVLEPAAMPGGDGGDAPITISQEILAAAGLVSTLDRPLKVLGQGDVTRKLFVVADAFSRSAVAKIEAAGGTAQVLEYPGRPATATTAEETEATDETEGTTDAAVAEDASAEPAEIEPASPGEVGEAGEDEPASAD